MEKNTAAQALAALRHKSLTPERRKEIASIAGKKSVQIRRENKAKKLSPTQ